MDPLELNFKLHSTALLNDLETTRAWFNKDKDIENQYNIKIRIRAKFKSIASNSNWKYHKFSTDKDISKFLINLSKDILVDKQ